MSNRPDWLRRNENGTIGEARSTAFLIDRFWVLERSVDIEGADLIIQRRVTSSSLLARKPPRLGIVQAKFYMTEKTDHFIPARYVRGPGGLIWEGFFLNAHTGYEDEARSFLMTAQDIHGECPLMAEGDHARCYKVSGRWLLRGTKYLVTNQRESLGNIEKVLSGSDFSSNRRFFALALPGGIPEDAIAPEYRLTPDYWEGSIPKHFATLKRRAIAKAVEFERMLEKLDVILASIEPREALGVASELDDMLSGGEPYENLVDAEFQSDLDEHLRISEELNQRGVLHEFVQLRERLKEAVWNGLGSHMPLAVHQAFLVEVHLDQMHLASSSIETKVVERAGSRGATVLRGFGYVEESVESTGTIIVKWPPADRPHEPTEPLSDDFVALAGTMLFVTHIMELVHNLIGRSSSEM